MISVITPTTTGGFSHLVKLIPSLETEPNHELIIIDNASNDGTGNYLSRQECTVRFNKTKMNFSESNNYGASIAQGEYLLFLNNDTYVVKGALAEMERTFALDEKIAVVGCQLVLMDYKKVQHAGVMFTEDYLPYELGLAQPFGVPELLMSDPRVKAIREVPSVTAACMMVRADVFKEVGGFDEKYIFSWEDTDLVLKIREKGYKVYYNGQAVVYHKHFGSKSSGRFLNEAQNRARYDELWINTGRAKAVLKGFINA